MVQSTQSTPTYGTEHPKHTHLWYRAPKAHPFIVQSTQSTPIYGTEHPNHNHLWYRAPETHPFMVQSTQSTPIYGTEHPKHTHLWYRAPKAHPFISYVVVHFIVVGPTIIPRVTFTYFCRLVIWNIITCTLLL